MKDDDMEIFQIDEYRKKFTEKLKSKIHFVL